MYIRVFYLILILMLAPILVTYADLELSFSDTTPPSPLTDDVVAVGATFTISVIAKAPVGTVLGVEFKVTWTPADSVDYNSVSLGNFLSDAFVTGVDSNTPGSQTVAVGATPAGGPNAVESGVLVTLEFTKNTSEGSVRFGFSDTSAMDTEGNWVTVIGIPSGDISLPVAFSSLSAEVSEVGVTLRWHTAHEVDNAGFNVLRSTSREGGYTKLNRYLIEGQGTSAVPRDYQYIDSEVTAGSTYYYRVEALDLLGDRSPSKTMKLEVSEDALRPPEQSGLGQNYPNPGNPDTWIPYVLSSDGEARIEIYNMAGQLMRTLDLGYKNPGRYVFRDRAAYWDGRSSSGEEVPSGVYFYTITIKAGSFVATRKLVMLK